MWPYGYGAGWGWMLGGWIMMIVFWGLVIVGIVALVRAVSDRAAVAQPRDDEAPIETLRRRYAAGELTKEQFEEMKRNVACSASDGLDRPAERLAQDHRGRSYGDPSCGSPKARSRSRNTTA